MDKKHLHVPRPESALLVCQCEGDREAKGIEILHVGTFWLWGHPLQAAGILGLRGAVVAVVVRPSPSQDVEGA